MNNYDLFDKDGVLGNEDLLTENVEDVLGDDEDNAIDAMFARKKKSRAPKAQNAQDDDVRTAPPQNAHRKSPDLPPVPDTPAHAADEDPEAPPETENVTFTAQDVNEASATITNMLETGKLSAALDLVLSLPRTLRAAVRDTVTVTIPLGSHDNELRQIAAGALIQSYLEQGRIAGDDIEDKLYAIIESSEPEYDEDDEIIEQTPEEILYKVTACTVFCAQLTEATGAHVAEKAAMYGRDDSVLDSFLTENLSSVMKKDRRHLTALADAVRMNGGTVSRKLDAYLEQAKKSTENPVMRFLGDNFAFRVTACVLAVLCLISVIVYLCSRSGFLSLIATDNTVMLFVIGAEIFFTVGMVLLAILIGYKSSAEPQKKERVPANGAPRAPRPPRR